MPFLSVIFGGLLIALGLWGYFSGGREHPTALIPAYFGAFLVAAGFVAMVERFLKHAMHLAALVALVGCVMAAWRFAPMLAEQLDLGDRKTVSLGGMTLLCGLFVALCIGSFIQSRRRRRAAQAQGQTRL